jgi:hypothetical protein
MIRVRMLRSVAVGYGTHTKEFEMGALIDLPIGEASAWCLRGWAEPVGNEAQQRSAGRVG